MAYGLSNKRAKKTLQTDSSTVKLICENVVTFFDTQCSTATNLQ